VSDEEGWAEVVGNSSLSSAASDFSIGEDERCVRLEVGEGDNTCDKTPFCDIPSHPRNICQPKILSSPTILVQQPLGEDFDSDRRRKVSLEQQFMGSGSTKRSLQKSNSADHLSPHMGACNSACPSPHTSACKAMDGVEPMQVGSAPSGNSVQIPIDVNLGPFDSGLGCSSVKAPASCLELLRRFGTPQIADASVSPLNLMTRLIGESGEPAPVVCSPPPFTIQREDTVHAEPVVAHGGSRPRTPSSTISSPRSGSPSKPGFFSRDAHTKKKRGRPRKAARGRSRQKGSLTKRGGASTTRQLFKEGELGENLRASPGGGGAVDS
jgi:hypothetical protein